MTSTISYKGNLSTECTHLKSSKTIVTDAPIDNNGNGQSFSPTDLVATGLAACMITVMGIKAAASDIAFNLVQANVLKIMSSNPRRIAEIKVTIRVEESWTEKEKQILEKTARACPIAQSLHPDTKQEVIFIYK
ncbi:MAG: OsmC family protein [Bacteroidia bacterium]|jgi:putative redox protein|nr:OsmC family protein [Bacteroidia bacterium]